MEKDNSDINYKNKQYWENLGLLYDVPDEDKDFLIKNYIALTDFLLKQVYDGSFESVCFPVLKNLVKQHKLTKIVNVKELVETIEKISKENLYDNDKFNSSLDDFIDNYAE